jgi:hypothetical protein
VTNKSHAALEAPWRAVAEQLPHQQSQIRRSRMHDQPFENVFPSAQVDPAHPAPISGCDRPLMPAIVLILKFLETDQIIGQHCSITLRKALVL